MSIDIIHFKCVLSGETNAGKTSLLKKYIDNTFTNDSKSTIGCAYNSKLITFKKKSIKLDIWDTAGQEKYRSMLPMYYKNAKIVFICFDLSREDSQLDDSINYWLNELENNCDIDDREIIFVGTKSDNKIDSAENTINNLTTNYPEIKLIETSSKTGKNVEHLFTFISKKLLDDFLKLEEESEPIPNLVMEENEVGCFKCNIS